MSVHSCLIINCIYTIAFWKPTNCLVLAWHQGCVKPLPETFGENQSKFWRHKRNVSLFLVVDPELVYSWECHLWWFRNEYPDICTYCDAYGQSIWQLGPPTHSSRCRQRCCACYGWSAHSHPQQHAVQAAGLYQFLLWQYLWFQDSHQRLG